jgi:hypothetical protein
MPILIGLKLIPGVLFILWGYFLITDIRKHRALRKKFNLKFYFGLPQLKTMVEERNDEELRNEYLELKKYHKRKFLIWTLSCVAAVIVLLILGIVSAKHS